MKFFIAEKLQRKKNTSLLSLYDRCVKEAREYITTLGNKQKLTKKQPDQEVDEPEQEEDENLTQDDESEQREDEKQAHDDESEQEEDQQTHDDEPEQGDDE